MSEASVKFVGRRMLMIPACKHVGRFIFGALLLGICFRAVVTYGGSSTSASVSENISSAGTDKTDVTGGGLVRPRVLVSVEETIVRSPKYDISHLTQPGDVVAGPMQDDEALLLFALVKVVRPKTILEFGYLPGSSAINFLKAMDQDAKLFSVDRNLPPPTKIPSDQRFRFLHLDQNALEFRHVENRLLDLVLIDTDSDLAKLQNLWARLQGILAPDAIVAVHNTGLHAPGDGHHLPVTCDFPRKCGKHHTPYYRQFVRWVTEKYPEWGGVHLLCFTRFRHGITLLQRRYPLSETMIASMGDAELQDYVAREYTPVFE